MIETILQIQKYVYPFDQCLGIEDSVKVEDIQAFPSIKLLQQKKSQMQVKSKLLDSHYLIRLLKIYQEDLTLHYIYEHVPHSLANYVNKYWKGAQKTQFGVSSRLVVKKFNSELMMLISYLVWNKIEVDLCPRNLGFTRQGKLKLFMSARCKMGHKTQVSLVAYYNSCKEKILQFINGLLSIESFQEQTPNFVIKGNKLVFPEDDNQLFPQNTEMEDYSDCQSGVFNSQLFNQPSRKYSTSSCINYPQYGRSSFMRQSQTHKQPKNSNLSQAKFSARGSRKRKGHKNSFQFGTSTPRGERFSTTSGYEKDASEDKDDAKSFTHSRSIRIEFEQKMDPYKKKKRKDSYKVKVTSFHEYEMDNCDPRELFQKNPQGSQDLFQHFTKKAQDFAKKEPQKSEEDQEYDNYDDLQGEIPFVSKYSTPEQGQTPTRTSSVHNLSEKVRLAKEKASNILNKYMKTKKMSSFGQ